MAKITSIEGIGSAYAEKLATVGIGSLEMLLRRGATRRGREEISKFANVSETLVLKWVNRADLSRIRGVGPEYAELLEASEVDSVPELAQRNVAHLLEKMAKVNAAKKLVRRLPGEKQILRWVAEASSLDRVVTH